KADDDDLCLAMHLPNYMRRPNSAVPTVPCRDIIRERAVTALPRNSDPLTRRGIARFRLTYAFAVSVTDQCR
ncbi:MAG: hypothetical protein AAFY64_06150, partial [Pseudomonadota bacterium]